MALTHLVELAQKYYVQESMSPKDIAKKLKCSEATIRSWINKGGWSELRKEEINLKISLLSQSKEVTYKLGQQILGLLNDKKDVPAQLLNAYSRLASGLYSTKELEDKELEEELSTKDNGGSLSDKTKHALKKAGLTNED